MLAASTRARASCLRKASCSARSRGTNSVTLRSSFCFGRRRLRFVQVCLTMASLPRKRRPGGGGRRVRGGSVGDGGWPPSATAGGWSVGRRLEAAGATGEPATVAEGLLYLGWQAQRRAPRAARALDRMVRHLYARHAPA